VPAPTTTSTTAPLPAATTAAPPPTTATTETAPIPTTAGSIAEQGTSTVTDGGAANIRTEANSGTDEKSTSPGAGIAAVGALGAGGTGFFLFRRRRKAKGGA
jgi:LPXTG-motif cell wall-anchored protein